MKVTTNTAKYAVQELDILVKTVKDPIIKDFIPEIIALAEKFGKSGQSGGSAPFTAVALSQAIKAVCLNKPICDITGIDDEWVNVSQYAEKSKKVWYQNKRCGAIFKDGKKGKPYYLDAVVIKTQSGQNLTCNSGAQCKDGSKIYSRQYIKKFPFKPKTFYIDVVEKEIKKDDWEYFVKNENQLKQVFKYYDRFTY